MAKAFQVSTTSSLGDEIKHKMLSLGYPMKWAALGRALASETSHHYVEQSAKIKIAMSIWRKQHRKPKIEKDPPKCPHCVKEATDWCSTCSADESHQFNSEKPAIWISKCDFSWGSLFTACSHARLQIPKSKRPKTSAANASGFWASHLIVESFSCQVWCADCEGTKTRLEADATVSDCSLPA